jgi:hypothetical protein
MPIACPEIAAFSTVWREDNSQNGLQFAGAVGAGKPGSAPSRGGGGVSGAGYQTGRMNVEQDFMDRERI